MIHAIRQAEEKKKMQAMKETEQAEGRRRRAESRAPAQGTSQSAAGTGGKTGNEGVGEEEADQTELGKLADHDQSTNQRPREEDLDELSSTSEEESELEDLKCEEIDKRLAELTVLKEKKKGKGKEKKKSKGRKRKQEEEVERDQDGKKGEGYQTLIEKDQITGPILPNEVPNEGSQPGHAEERMDVRSLTDRLVQAIESQEVKEIKKLRKELDKIQRKVEDEKENGAKEEKKRKSGDSKKKKKKKTSKKKKSSKRRKKSHKKSTDNRSSSSISSLSSSSDSSGSQSSGDTSSSIDSSEGDNSSSETDSSSGSDDSGNQPINFTFTKLSSFDLPDLPPQWEKNF